MGYADLVLIFRFIIHDFHFQVRRVLGRVENLYTTRVVHSTGLFPAS